MSNVKQPILAIDHSHIDPTELELAMANAQLDPDGQVFPWRPMYPLAGQTVYSCANGVGLLWIVVGKLPQPEGEPLVGASDRDVLVTCNRERLRPVSWSPLQEAVLTEMRDARTSVTECDSTHGDQRCRKPAGHAGAHAADADTEWWTTTYHT